jgi:hypothetical protein
MRKLVLILIAFIAAATFIRAFDKPAAEELSQAATEAPTHNE